MPPTRFELATPFSLAYRVLSVGAFFQERAFRRKVLFPSVSQIQTELQGHFFEIPRISNFYQSSNYRGSIIERFGKILKLFGVRDCMPIDLRKQVEKVVEKNVKPHLAMHGGDIEVMDVKDGVVTVKLKGACMGCPMATMTLKGGVERELKEAIPQIKRVEAFMG